MKNFTSYEYIITHEKFFFIFIIYVLKKALFLKIEKMKSNEIQWKNPHSIEDKPRAGRPITAVTTQNIAIVKDLIEDNSSISYDQMIL